MFKKLVLKIFNLKNIFFYFLKKLSFLIIKKRKFNDQLSINLNYNWIDYPTRTELIQSLIEKNNYKSYLEIGCDHNQNFSKIKIKDKVGVDPIRGGTYRGSSNEFFKHNQTNFDIIFIDGLHTKEQVLIDIKNSLEFLNNDGIIVIHDCIPTTFLQQYIPRVQSSWTGTVWKAIISVRQKYDLDTATIIADHGIGMIINRKNTNQLSKLDSDGITFQNFATNHKEWLNCIEYDEYENWIAKKSSN